MLNVFSRFAALGFTHVIPSGFDHILFILSLCLLNPGLRSLTWQCSVFTVAHSLSMALAALGVILPDPGYIEPLIAISILYTALENIIRKEANRYRLMVVFGFGIVHGLGFASALNEIGLPASNMILALFSFNLGVEAGQISVLLLAFLPIYWFCSRPRYRENVLYPVSGIIGSMAMVMTVDRILIVF